MESKLSSIQERLSDLHNDRTKFFSFGHVCNLYVEFQVAVDEALIDDPSTLSPVIHQTLLAFSLAFINSGHTHEYIAMYAKLVTIRSLFAMLFSDTSFTPNELRMLQSSVQRAKSEPEEANNSDIPQLSIVKNQVHFLFSEIDIYSNKILEAMSELPEHEHPLYSQITRIRREVLAEIVNSEFCRSKLEHLSDKLEKVTQYIGQQDASVSESEILQRELQKTRTLINLFPSGVNMDDLVAEDTELAPIFHELKSILPELDVFIMTRRWTLRATDLYRYINFLLEIMPKLYVNLKSPSELDQVVPMTIEPVHKYQYLVTYMSRKAWALIFKLLDTAEPVSEALSTLYSQLVTMKRCLLEVRMAGSINNLRELYPYQMKLSSLDNCRTGGKFVVNGEVPTGQGVLNGLLTECFDILYELKVELEEKGENEAEDSLAADEDSDDDYDDVDVEEEDEDENEDEDEDEEDEEVGEALYVARNTKT